MRIFRCDACGNALYFENMRCLRCGSDLAFLPDRMDLCAIEPQGDAEPGLWRRKRAAQAGAGAATGTVEATGAASPPAPAPAPAHAPAPAPALEPSASGPAAARCWRLCQHRGDAAACNFAIPQHDPNPLCASCRLTRVLPDLSVTGHPERWGRIEAAKRRLFFTLARLGLEPVDPRDGQPHGPLFRLLASLPGQPVTTGHADGVITLDVAEADEDERARRQLQLHEPYRTLLGHLRHESGHYYWPRLVPPCGRLESFRQAFGDERADYAQALQAHYARTAPPAPWQAGFVSAYATAHPWEDWAETWAHYLHMVDLLETAASYNTRVALPGQPDSSTEEVQDPFDPGPGGFEALVSQWVPVTLLVNSLNRSLGQADAYPFALGPGALAKLRFVHELVRDCRNAQPTPAGITPT